MYLSMQTCREFTAFACSMRLIMSTCQHNNYLRGYNHPHHRPVTTIGSYVDMRCWSVQDYKYLPNLAQGSECLLVWAHWHLRVWRVTDVKYRTQPAWQDSKHLVIRPVWLRLGEELRPLPTDKQKQQDDAAGGLTSSKMLHTYCRSMHACPRNFSST